MRVNVVMSVEVRWFAELVAKAIDLVADCVAEKTLLRAPGAVVAPAVLSERRCQRKLALSHSHGYIRRVEWSGQVEVDSEW
jgi:hypothetical protein